MNDKLEGTVHNIKTPGLGNPESYVLKHAKFNTHMVPLFTDLNKAQIYKIPSRISPHREIEILMSFDYLHLFRPKEHKEDCHIRKRNNQYFLFKFEHKKYIHVGDNYLNLKQMMKL